MELVIKIRMDSPAFGSTDRERIEELARILREYIADAKRLGDLDHDLRGLDGKLVGYAELQWEIDE
jgi:hypothetical protein